MLRRHRCIIDLNDNILRIGTTATQAPFLTEKKIISPSGKKEGKISGNDDNKKHRRKVGPGANGAVVIQYEGKAESTIEQTKSNEKVVAPRTDYSRTSNTKYVHKNLEDKNYQEISEDYWAE